MKPFVYLFTTLALLTGPAALAQATAAAPKVAGKEKAPPPPDTLVATPTPAIGLPQPVVQTRSLVKVNASYQSYSLQIPWQKESVGGRRGLGVVLSGNRILVTAQMVADATYIELELPETGQKISAHVLAVDYEANLALLEANVADKAKAFFSGLQPMSIDSSGRVGDGLSIWQTGRVGDLIVTPVNISKVMIQGYVVDGSAFLVYEAIGIIRSEANSFTLPVVKNGKLAGLLLRYDSKNQVATILPAPIIEHFLKDVGDGKYDGFANLGVEFQLTLDDQFREYLGLKADEPGVYVSKVIRGGSAEKIGVQAGDIMLSINGSSIDARGDYKDPQYGALGVSHIVRGRAFVGDKVEIKVRRDNSEVTLKGELTRKLPQDYLVMPYQFDRGPKYVLNGGLLFQELSRAYLNSFGEDRQTGIVLRLARMANQPEKYEKEGRKKLVFLSAVLPTSSTQGYERLGGQVVNEINGIQIKELTDVAEAFKSPQDGLHTVRLDSYPFVLYVDAFSMEKDNLQLLNGMFRVGSLTRLE